MAVPFLQVCLLSGRPQAERGPSRGCLSTPSSQPTSTSREPLAPASGAATGTLRKRMARSAPPPQTLLSGAHPRTPENLRGRQSRGHQIKGQDLKMRKGGRAETSQLPGNQRPIWQGTYRPSQAMPLPHELWRPGPLPGKAGDMPVPLSPQDTKICWAVQHLRPPIDTLFKGLLLRGSPLLPRLSNNLKLSKAQIHQHLLSYNKFRY